MKSKSEQTTISSTEHAPELLQLNVLDIYLDPLNPRHEQLPDQAAIIAHLVSSEQIKNLARDIASIGTSPIDLIAVMKDASGRHIALEGNRRLCALKLLNDPSLATPSDQGYFAKLINNGIPAPGRVNCVLFSNREEADQWIERRHGRETEGVGIRRWDATQLSRYNTRREKPDRHALALSLIDYATDKGFISKDQGANVITTVARYFGNPYLRRTLGITSGSTDPKVRINVPPAEFDAALRRFFYDLNQDDPVIHSRTKQDDWHAYADQLKSEGLAPTPTGVESELSDMKSTGGESDAKGSNLTRDDQEVSSRKSSNRNPDSRKYIVPSDFKVQIRDKILKRVFDEMKQIAIDDFPLAVSLLTRAFLENLYSQFHERQENYIQSETHVLMLKVIKLIESDNHLSRREKSALGALRRVQSNSNNVLNPKTLGANAHASIYPNATELKKEWDNISAIVEYMIAKL